MTPSSLARKSARNGSLRCEVRDLLPDTAEPTVNEHHDDAGVPVPIHPGRSCDRRRSVSAWGSRRNLSELGEFIMKKVSTGMISILP